MDFQELVKFRKSSRVPYKIKPIPRDDLKKILIAAQMTPTPHNTQPFEIIIVEDREIIKKISEVKFRLNKEFIDEHFFWTRYSYEELREKKDGVHVNSLPSFVLDLKKNHELIDDDKFWDKAGELYSLYIQASSLLLFVIYNRNRKGCGPLKHLWGIISIGAVMENIWLAANDLGISVQLVSGQLADPEAATKLKQILKISDKNYQLMLFFRFGYERNFFKKEEKFRRDLKDFVHVNYFGNKFTE